MLSKNRILHFCVVMVLLSAGLPCIAQDTYPPANVSYDDFVELAQALKPYRDSRLVDFNEWLELAKDPNTVILDTRSKKAYDAVHIKGAIHLDFSDFTSYKLSNILGSKQKRILIYCNNNFTENGPNKGIGRRGPYRYDGLTRINGAMGPKGPSPGQSRGPAGPMGVPSKNQDPIAGVGPAGLNQPASVVQGGSVGSQNPTGVYSPDGPSLQSEAQRVLSKVKSNRSPVALNIPTFITLYFYGYKDIYELSSLVHIYDQQLELVGTEIPVKVPY